MISVMEAVAMEKIVKQALLYDFYGELLTEHQKSIYEEVVVNDFSLSEIAEEFGISRQGVHDLIKRCNKILTDYEEKLHLVEKFIETKEMVNHINQLARDYTDTDHVESKVECIAQIQKISNDILKNL